MNALHLFLKCSIKHYTNLSFNQRYDFKVMINKAFVLLSGFFTSYLKYLHEFTRLDFIINPKYFVTYVNNFYMTISLR